ncbi:putative nuclease HARBI1 [Dermacentor silvarum]|uniref:putative nuclease HARBI1 n=1 Tax=Dermacentor silvarum TaxID=543639 RepID=UPI0021016421|nr:putative nuclease HARBI1 [Dermacentor silvarum]
MADHASFVEYILRVDELFGGVMDDNDIADVPRQRLRDRLNPMEHFNNSEFLARYRFTKCTVKKLLDYLPLEENASNRGHPLPPMLQLLIALRFYGAGTFQVVTGDLVNVSQPTVSRVIERVSRLIATHVFPIVVKFPSTDNEFRATMVEFYRIAKFPELTGCIDCTHIRIKSPGGPNGEVYRNRKGYFSINVQVIAGPKLQFFDVVSSWPGSVHDSRIFDNSRARVLYETKRVPGLLLGDAGYACMPFLMTPMADSGRPNSPESRYQAAQIRTRNTVERAFGVWKRRFPCLDMGLQHLAERSAVVTTACAALHNLAVLRQDPEPPAVVIPQHLRRQQPDVASQTDTLHGSQCRMRLIARAFH